MTKEELKNQITELKETCKKLAEEYRERYNQDNEDKIALNMFYHNVISYNDYESVLALFENRNSMIMCFSAPPVLTEETVEINLKRIAELEKENTEQKDEVRKLKLLVSSLVYEINQIWDINEMNDDLRRCAEKIDREVQLSKMEEDNRMVISALGFAIVPPKPKLDVKEIKEND